MVYKRQGRSAWFVAVPTPHGWVKRSTGTTHKPTALAMERMLTVLGPRGRRAWDLLERVADNTLALGELYDAYAQNDLDGLRARLTDVDLEPHVAVWLERHREHVAPSTIAQYEYLARSFIPAGVPFPRSRFTVDALDAWLAAYPGGRSTKHKARSAMSQFAQYLVRAKVLPVNPMRSVPAPGAAPPRLRWLEVADMKRLANYQPEPYCALSALLGGTGIEVSVAVKLLRRDVDLARREIRAAGTKTHSRDRIVRCAEWAWPYLEERCAGLTPNDRLFPGVDRWMASAAHRAACPRAGIEGYQLRDQRHSYAVRAARAGTPAELIARQLGHANAVLVLKVYGRFMPSQQDRDKWERIAAMQDAATDPQHGAETAHPGATGTARGTAPRGDMSQPPVNGWAARTKDEPLTRYPRMAREGNTRASLPLPEEAT